MNCAFIIRKWCYGIKVFWTKMIVFLNFGFGPIWYYLNIFGPFYNFKKFGWNHNFKKFWDWQSIILKFWNWTYLQTFITFWAILQFYKVLGSNWKFRKNFTVAGNCSIRLTGFKIWKTENGAECIQNASGLPDSESGKSIGQNFEFCLNGNKNPAYRIP